MEQPVRQMMPPHDAAAAVIERRGAIRAAVPVRPGKLIADGVEFLCAVRNVSASGLQLRLFHELPPHSELAIKLDTGERYRIVPVWRSGEHAGFRFRDPADAALQIAAQASVGAIRPPRLHIAVEATLSAGGLRTPVILRDISQDGVALDCRGWLMLDELVRIECPILPTIHAKVRWRRPPRYGLGFDRLLPLEELARACTGNAAGSGEVV